MLKDRAKQIFLFIHDRCRSGRSPTLREIGEHFGITSTNGVRFHLEALERYGYLKRNKRIARGLDVTLSGIARLLPELDSRTPSRSAPADLGIPILGRVAAGSPLLADENVEGRLDLDAVFPSRSKRFALRVEGDSMLNAGIHDGDLVVVRQAERAENGDIVVALLGDEATVKTLRVSKGRVELHPANPAHQKRVVREGDEFRVLGVVLGLVRSTASRKGSARG